MQTSKNPFIFLIPAILLAWGLSWPAMKLALQDMPPIWMGSLRMIIGSIILFLIILFSKKPFFPKRQDWVPIIIICLLQMTLFNLFLNLGLQKVEASRGVILVFSTPLWVTPLAIIFLKEKLHFLTFIGLLFGFLGVIVLFDPFNFNWKDTSSLIGDGLLILTAISWALSIFYVRISDIQSSPLLLAPWQMLLSAILLFLAALFFEPHPTIHWSMHLGLLMLYIGPIATAFGYWGVIEMSRRMSPINMSLTMLGVPIVGFLSSAYILKEPLSSSKIIALGFLLLGLIFVALARKIQKKHTSKTIYENEPI